MPAILSQASFVVEPSPELVQRHPKPPDNRGYQWYSCDAVSLAFGTPSAGKHSLEYEMGLSPISKPDHAQADPTPRSSSLDRWWRGRRKPPNATVTPIRRSHRVVNINDEPSATKHLPSAEAAFVLPISSSAYALWMFGLQHPSLELVWWERTKPPNMAACRRFLYEAVNALSKRVGSATYPGRPLTPSNAMPPLSLMFFVSAALALRYSLWMPCGVHLLIAVLGQRI